MEPKLPSPSNHSKVSAAVVAGAITAFVISVLNGKFGIDISGQESNLTVIVMAIVGYFVKDES